MANWSAGDVACARRAGGAAAPTSAAAAETHAALGPSLHAEIKAPCADAEGGDADDTETTAQRRSNEQNRIYVSRGGGAFVGSAGTRPPPDESHQSGCESHYYGTNY